MLSSKVLGAAERNIQKRVCNRQNSQEIWGGILAVLLFGNDYQLWLVIEEGAIQGYSKMSTTTPSAPTIKQSAAQLLCQWGTYLFIHIMTESMFILSKKGSTKCTLFGIVVFKLNIFCFHV